MKISEIFYSIQGEGKNTGFAMVFVRLSGCNLRCSFCDTTYAFEDGRDMTESEILVEVRKHPANWVCITGGEPLMQDISSLVDSFKAEGFKVQIESNGTVFQPIFCDWLVISPKEDEEPNHHMLERANEIKLVIDSPVALVRANNFEVYPAYLSLQPEGNREDITELCINYIKANPKWRLSLQVHKLIGID